MRFDTNGQNFEIVARGVRNTVGFTFLTTPQTSRPKMIFSDNGRDKLGDNQPPDELNAIPLVPQNGGLTAQLGLHFGYPFCHGNGIVDPELGQTGSCANIKKPVSALRPHAAALGVAAETFGLSNFSPVFIAEHGSWNSTVPVDPRVSIVKTTDYETFSASEAFVSGWQGPNGRRWGRPVDVLGHTCGGDKSLLISDDQGGAIYRVTLK